MCLSSLSCISLLACNLYLALKAQLMLNLSGQQCALHMEIVSSYTLKMFPPASQHAMDTHAAAMSVCLLILRVRRGRKWASFLPPFPPADDSQYWVASGAVFVHPLSVDPQCHLAG